MGHSLCANWRSQLQVTVPIEMCIQLEKGHHLCIDYQIGPLSNDEGAIVP